jgi:hypothetical protein
MPLPPRLSTAKHREQSLRATIREAGMNLGTTARSKVEDPCTTPEHAEKLLTPGQLMRSLETPRVVRLRPRPSSPSTTSSAGPRRTSERRCR